MDLLISTRPKIGTKLFAVVVINNDGHLYSRYQGLNLTGEPTSITIATELAKIPRLCSLHSYLFVRW